jgi:hypothetical protein
MNSCVLELTIGPFRLCVTECTSRDNIRVVIHPECVSLFVTLLALSQINWVGLVVIAVDTHPRSESKFPLPVGPYVIEPHLEIGWVCHWITPVIRTDEDRSRDNTRYML